MAGDNLTRVNIAIDRDLTVEDKGICAYIETWFDVDKKFSLETKRKDDTWVNFYATYNPDTADFSCVYTVNNDKGSSDFPYVPTPDEVTLITTMMEEICLREHGCNLHTLWISNFEQ